MNLSNLIFGRPLETSAEQDHRIGVAAGIPIFGLDGLTSAAYGPEQTMALLIPLGLIGMQRHLLPIFSAILTLLVILYFSYRQTITAYPNGGGSYTVATENLGDMAGLFAAAALMIDYILTAAVGVSAGVTALVSAVPELHKHQLGLCLLILAIIVGVNLRGVKESGAAFMLPTLLFVGTLLSTVVVGILHSIAAHGHPTPLALPPPAPAPTMQLLTTWLLMKAFAGGCAAMTGVEAVSNGVTAFKEPKSANANRALTVIIGVLVVLLWGLSYMAKVYGVSAMPDPDAHNYQSVLSIEVAAVFGRGWFYFLTMGSVLGALAFSANTAFAGFPRLARAIAMRDYFPHVFLVRGRRLLFTYGIYVLAGLTALLLIIFDGVTDRLIPLYAIGAFLAFTLSQAGMVRHWMRCDDPHRHIKMFLNGLGAVATGITLLVVLVAKFEKGAWMTAILVPLLIAMMLAIKRHYASVAVEVEEPCPMRTANLEAPIVVIPMARRNKIAEKALRFGMTLSPLVKVVHVDSDDEDADAVDRMWQDMVIAPLRAAGLPEPELITVKSSYRTIISPLIDVVLRLEEQYPHVKIAVILPELVVRRWWEYFLHNQRVQFLKLALLVKGKQRIVVVNIPWYLGLGTDAENNSPDRSFGELKDELPAQTAAH